MTSAVPPSPFNGGRDYRLDASATRRGHLTSTEQQLYSVITDRSRDFLSGLPPTNRHVADLCSADGGCSARVDAVLQLASLQLVDIEPCMLETARRREWRARECDFVLTNASQWRSKRPVSCILMNSAYHHILDQEKLTFMKAAATALADCGRVFVGEHFLPEYDRPNTPAYYNAVETFYSARIAHLQVMGDDDSHISVIRRTAQHCWERDYEYQVPYRTFLDHLTLAGLEVVGRTRVWPTEGKEQFLSGDVGSFVVELRRGK